MSRMERVYTLHQMLKRRTPVTLKEMMERLERSRATIQRDLEYMRDRLMAPIVYQSTSPRGYLYSPDEDDFELPGIWFAPPQLKAIQLTKTLLRGLNPDYHDQTLKPLEAWVQKMIGQDEELADSIAERIVVLPYERRRTDPKHFDAIATAVIHQRALYMTYQARYDESRSERVVDPSRLILHRDNWYLLGWCQRSHGPRTFSLDRVLDCRETGHEASPWPQGDPESFMKESFGIFLGPPQDVATLKFTPTRARWIQAEQWHPQQTGQATEDGGYLLKIPYANPTELILDILRFGPDVEVLSPQTLRDEVADRLRRAAAQYTPEAT